MEKRIVITGASRGIGRACAEEFAKNGDSVMICYNKNEAAADEVLEKCRSFGVICEKCEVDVTDEISVRRMISLAEYKLGGIDVLVNNAGISESGLFSDFTVEQYNRIFNTNLLGQMLCAREALKVMKENGGRIINVSSMWGICGASCEVLYSASKAAVIGFTKALAKEAALSGITVNCIAPGVIDTDMNRRYGKETMEVLKEQTPLGRIGLPKDVAKAAVFLAGDGADFITGEVLNVSGGFVI